MSTLQYNHQKHLLWQVPRRAVPRRPPVPDPSLRLARTSEPGPASPAPAGGLSPRWKKHTQINNIHEKRKLFVAFWSRISRRPCIDKNSFTVPPRCQIILCVRVVMTRTRRIRHILLRERLPKGRGMTWTLCTLQHRINTFCISLMGLFTVVVFHKSKYILLLDQLKICIL